VGDDVVWRLLVDVKLRTLGPQLDDLRYRALGELHL
jgi:hypothetical protein